MALKKSSLISNLLNRVDGTYLAVRNVKGDGCEFYFESTTHSGNAANKEILFVLDKSELESLCFNKALLHKQNLNVKNFNLDSFKPVLKKEKVSVVVKRDYSDKSSELKTKLDLEMLETNDNKKKLNKIFNKTTSKRK